MDANTWVIVLAAGDGTRLRSLTTLPGGVVVPKQYCAFGTDRTLLERSLDRAARIVPRDPVVTVVAAAHRRWWAGASAAGRAGHVVVQPRNRGTAPGLLLPLLHVLERDRRASVLVLPSDHHVEREGLLLASMRRALDAAGRDGDAVTLLGMRPEGPSADFGWILPGAPFEGGRSRVEAFVEKPPRAEAERLMARGACWSSFIMAARAATLRDLAGACLPEVVEGLEACRSAGAPALEALYDVLAPADFSRDVLERPSSRSALRLLPVPACGWTDLGTPDRVAAWRAQEARATPPRTAQAAAAS